MKKNSIFSFLCTAMMLSPTMLLAEGEGVAPQQGILQTVVMIGIAILFFYVILWRPEQKRRKALEDQRSKLKKGDRVTAMGIIGTVDKVDKDSVILRMVDGSKIEMLAAAITEVMAPKEEAKSENE